MKKMHILFIGVLPILLLLVTCAQDTPTSVSPSAVQTEITLAKENSEVGVTFFRVPNINTPGGMPAPNIGELVEDAESEIERSAAGIGVEIETSELPPGAYSVWAIIDDDANGMPDTGRRAGGAIVDDDGELEFEAFIAAGPLPVGPNPNGGDFVTILFSDDNSFDNPLTARIFFVIRQHGPVVPSMVDEQTNTFGGGCSNDFSAVAPNVVPTGVGTAVCFDPQITEVHEP